MTLTLKVSAQSDSGERPSFLPASEPQQSQEDTTAAPEVSDTSAPKTMNMQVEVPVPQPTAISPGQASQPISQPSISASASILNAGTGSVAQAAPMNSTATGSATTTVAASPTPAPENQGPAIIYDQDQKGIQQKPSDQPQEPTGPDPGKLLKEKRYNELEPLVIQSHDSALASALGWAFYNSNQAKRAYPWFEKAVQWNEKNYEAAYGMGLSLFRMGQYEKAAQIARWRMSEYPNMKNLLGDIQTAEAVSSYQSKNYDKSTEYLKEVGSFRKLTRDERLMQAWNYFQAGDLAQAQTAFEQLYREKQDKYAAMGVYAACAKSQDWNHIAEFSKTYGGPLESMYDDYVAAKYYNRRMYTSAYVASPDKFPELTNINTPVVRADGFVRYKSGDAGTSRLREYGGNISTSFYVGGTNRIDVGAGVSTMSSDNLPKQAQIGQYPIDEITRRQLAAALLGTQAEPVAYTHPPTTKYNSLVNVNVHYENEGTYSPIADIGMTPSGATISPTVLGNIGFRVNQDWGKVEIDGYRTSVTESILSAVGIRDPYSGKTWGRVVETGGKASAFLNLPSNFSLFAIGSVGQMTGQNVADNTHERVTLALSKNFVPPIVAAPQNYSASDMSDGKSVADGKSSMGGSEFSDRTMGSALSYFTLGPAVTYEHFDKNLDHYTYGQGGYFSPDSLVQGVVSAQLMTAEGRNYLVRASLSAGVQTYSEAASPYFPLQGSNSSSFAKSKDTTFIALVDVEGMLELNQHWAVTTHLSYNKTANYSEFYGSLGLQYFFEPREGLFAQDFPTF
ncbi:MAG: cellulose synthase subunit BcsC-related outer membrane protein [Chthoniobacteraceae bacterium]